MAELTLKDFAKNPNIVKGFTNADEIIEQEIFDFLEKGGKRATIGEERTWGGKTYVKQSSGWARKKSESSSSGKNPHLKGTGYEKGKPAEGFDKMHKDDMDSHTVNMHMEDAAAILTGDYHEGKIKMKDEIHSLAVLFHNVRQSGKTNEQIKREVMSDCADTHDGNDLKRIEHKVDLALKTDVGEPAKSSQDSDEDDKGSSKSGKPNRMSADELAKQELHRKIMQGNGTGDNLK